MRKRLAATLCVGLVFVAACMARTPASRQQHRVRPTRSDVMGYPAPNVPPDVRPPSLAMRTFRLPVSCVVKDYTSSLALLSVNTMRQAPSATLSTLDLRTGRTSTVLSHAVGGDSRVDILGARLGDGWIAWEEVTVGETMLEPKDVRWDLYTAPLGRGGVGLGRARRVDGGTSDQRSRPLFAFTGRDLVWMTNDTEAYDGTSEGRRGVVRRRSSVDGTVTVLCRLVSEIRALNVSDGKVVLSYRRGKDALATGFRVLEPATGASVLDFAPSDLAAVSHAPSFHAGAFAFSIRDGSPAAPVGAYLRSAEGSVTCLGTSASDPCFAGRYLFFENDPGQVPASAAPPKRSIRGFDLTSGDVFTLVSSSPEKEGPWQTSPGAWGYRRGVFVVYDDQTGFATDAGKERRTLIRVYDVGKATAGQGV